MFWLLKVHNSFQHDKESYNFCLINGIRGKFVGILIEHIGKIKLEKIKLSLSC